jgi:acyl carrier protein
MDSSAILKQLEAIGAKVFRCGPVELHAATTASDVGGWDSLSHVQFLMEVEKSIGVKFTVREAMKLANVGALVSLIEQKRAQKSAA